MQMFSYSVVLQKGRISTFSLYIFALKTMIFSNHLFSSITSCAVTFNWTSNGSTFLCHWNNVFQCFGKCRQTGHRRCDYITLIKLQAVCCSHISYTRCELTFVAFTKHQKRTGISKLKMSWIAVSIFSCEALDQALNVQWNMNDLFPEDSLTSFGIWPEWHTVSIMKLKLWACEDVCACFLLCVFLHLCVYL